MPKPAPVVSSFIHSFYFKNSTQPCVQYKIADNIRVILSPKANEGLSHLHEVINAQHFLDAGFERGWTSVVCCLAVLKSSLFKRSSAKTVANISSRSVIRL